MSRDDYRKKALEDNQKTLEEICASTYEALYRYIYFKVQNREEAEDITQETYVKVLSHFRNKDVKIDKYIGFLKTVSINILRDKWRLKKSRGTAVNLEAISPEETAVSDSSEMYAQRDMIRQALGGLSEEHRNVVVLRIIKGYSVAETAEILHKNEGNIRVMQYRALKSLAEIIKTRISES